jgi:hypothetical protein
MKPKNVIFSLCLILVMLALAVSRIQHEPKVKEAFDRHPSSIFYTPQALCQMSCLLINKENIGEIMQKGIINFGQSDRSARPCSVFVLQGQTRDGNKLKVTFSQCKNTTSIISCYDLQHNVECNCSENSKPK